MIRLYFSFSKSLFFIHAHKEVIRFNARLNPVFIRLVKNFYISTFFSIEIYNSTWYVEVFLKRIEHCKHNKANYFRNFAELSLNTQQTSASFRFRKINSLRILEITCLNKNLHAYMSCSSCRPWAALSSRLFHCRSLRHHPPARS